MPKADRLSLGGIKFLQEKQIAHFVTLMPNGSPQVTLVWVDVEPDGSHVLVNTSDSRVKMRNVGRDPRVAVSVVDSEDTHRFAIVRGKVVERIHEGADAHVDKLTQKYTGRETHERRPGDPRVILRIKPEYVLERGL